MSEHSSTDRHTAIAAFVREAGWGAATLSPLPGDASTRRYMRLRMGEKSALLMDQPQGAESPVAPAGASAQERRRLGYNAVARLAGADCARFVAADDYLRSLGLSAPEIYAADPAQGLVLMEDLGTDMYADVLTAGGDEALLYARAAEALACIHRQPAPEKIGRLPLFAYDGTALTAEVDLLTEWYFPVALNRTATDEEIAEHRALWHAALAETPTGPAVFVHRDYHAQNLLWLPQRSGAAAVGLIDFQDAVAGSAAYDLISLTEDARRDVAPALAEHTTRHYLDTMQAQGTPVDRDAFAAAMALFAAQRNAKIVGIFARLYKRDGKPKYLRYLPRVWSYLSADLAHPALSQLASWYDRKISNTVRTSVPAVKEIKE